MTCKGLIVISASPSVKVTGRRKPPPKLTSRSIFDHWRSYYPVPPLPTPSSPNRQKSLPAQLSPVAILASRLSIEHPGPKTERSLFPAAGGLSLSSYRPRVLKHLSKLQGYVFRVEQPPDTRETVENPLADASDCDGLTPPH